MSLRHAAALVDNAGSCRAYPSGANESAVAVAFARKVKEPLGPPIEILRRDTTRA